MRTFLLFAMLPFLAVAAHAGCTGAYDGEVHGGDDQPLTWKSTYKLIKPAAQDGSVGAIYQYERTVHNHSSEDVVFVFWDGAAFGKRKIRAHQEICEATQVASAKTGPATANLYYGASSHPYGTTIWVPKDGWGKDVLVASLEGLGTLKSAVTFESDANATGPKHKGSVVILSGITTDKSGAAYLDYSFENRSEIPLSVVLTEAGTKPFTLQPRSKVTKSVPFAFEGFVQKKAATVKIIGTDTAVNVESGAQIFSASTAKRAM